MLVRLKIKGNCVDDLFHILASNGYPVQMTTTHEPNVYVIDFMIDEESEDL